MSQPGEITSVELKRLLHDLKDKRPDIGIRFRLIGSMWSENFCHIKKLTDNEVIVEDQLPKIIINRFQDIVQLEIDSPFQAYKPFYHYKVNALKEEKFA